MAGGASNFVTFAPAMMDNKVAFKIVRGCDNGQDEVVWEEHFDVRSFERRAQMIAKNPVACARVYNRMCELFCEVLLGLPLSRKYRGARKREFKKGIFGKCYGYYGVTEVQGRGGLHLHILIWTLLGPALTNVLPI